MIVVVAEFGVQYEKALAGEFSHADYASALSAVAVHRDEVR